MKLINNLCSYILILAVGFRFNDGSSSWCAIPIWQVSECDVVLLLLQLVHLLVGFWLSLFLCQQFRDCRDCPSINHACWCGIRSSWLSQLVCNFLCSVGRVNTELYALAASTWPFKSEDHPPEDPIRMWMERYSLVLCMNSWQVFSSLDILFTLKAFVWLKLYYWLVISLFIKSHFKVVTSTYFLCYDLNSRSKADCYLCNFTCSNF